MDLETEIKQLIFTNCEGDYWDFKEEPHQDKAKLLHDIICLSNSLHKGNRYLILGVTDDGKVKGLTPNQKSRKVQTHFIDFLRTKSFAGDCRPEIELNTLIINNQEIDVLIIFDNPLKPYYLTEDYDFNLPNSRKTIVKANYIYTRTNDTNTPIDKSADIGKIEKMWMQRFGFDLSPLERMKLLLLKPDEWFKDIGNKSYSYHLKFPEFRIEFSEVSEFWEVFSFFFTNEKSFLGSAVFKYNSTTLFELEYMFCDEMRIELAVPDTEYIRLKDSENWYYYFDSSEPNGMFLYFITNKLTYTNSRSSAFPFLIFKNEQERKQFNEYVVNNEFLLEDFEVEFHGQDAKKRMNQQNKQSVIDPIFIDKINQLHKKWIDHNKSITASEEDTAQHQQL